MKIEWDYKNVQEAAQKAGKKGMEIIHAVRKGLIKGMEYYKSKIILEQMGRHSNTSLGVRSGFLRRSWKVIEKNDAGTIIVRLATEAGYAVYHQFGSKDWDGTFHGRTAGGRFVKRVARQVGAPKRHNLPKRLHIYEDYAISGPAILQRAVRDQVAILANL